MNGETLWTSNNGRWTVSTDFNRRRTVLIDGPTCSTYATLWPAGNVEIPNGERVPEYVKRAARLALKRAAENPTPEPSLVGLLRNGGV